ncbi:MAG: monovalent cation/H(+) antiporter subunit G [Dermatophilaceae bacterium]
MSWTDVADTVGLLAILAGAAFNLAAAIGLLRLGDTFSRQHAASKPQTLGVLLVILGVGLTLRTGLDIGMLMLVGVFQLLTIPVAGHMLTRAAYRGLATSDASSPPGPPPREG